MTFPFAEPLTPIPPGPRVIPEPPRRGEPGGEECGVCNRDDHLWADDNWAVYNPVGCSLAGTLWVATRMHVDSFSDLPAELQGELGGVIAKVERAILSLPDVARVHLYRWGDGGSHFHFWLMPRPLGMLEATKQFLPIWEEQLPPVPQEEIEALGKRLGALIRDASEM